MQLEFHQLDRRWEHLRVRHPARQRRLLASLAECGQQTPIVVVAAEGQTDRYVVIDGYKRIAALVQLGRDTVEAVVWPMSEAAAVLLDRSLRLSTPETALEVGWLLSELEQRFGYSLEELARRFDRSVSWVSRRLALVELLPEAIQQQVREGKIGAQVAMKFSMLAVAVNGLSRLDQILPAVEQLGRRHTQYGVRDDHYATVAEALLWTLEKGLADAFTPQVRTAWEAAYTLLAGTMQRATANERPTIVAA